MSEIQVNKIIPASGTDVTLGDSGDTFTVPSGAIITNSGTANGFGGGKFLQIQSYSTATFPSQTVTASMVDISSFLVTITPSASDSKILIMVSSGMVSAGSSTVSFVVEQAISGGATTLLGGTASSNHQSASFRYYQVSDQNHGYGASWNYLSSPSTTSEITYQLQWSNQETSYLNRSYSDTDVAPYGDRQKSRTTS
jgi:hypothetical protein